MFACLVVRLQRKVAPFTRSFLSLQLLQALTPQTWSPAEAKTCNLALFWSQNSIETRGVKLLTSIFHHAPGADYQIEILDVIFHSFIFFLSLMNWVSNAGDSSDSVRGSRWQIFIELWTVLSLHFLPWITEILAPMAPVYEGKIYCPYEGEINVRPAHNWLTLFTLSAERPSGPEVYYQSVSYVREGALVKLLLLSKP